MTVPMTVSMTVPLMNTSSTATKRSRLDVVPLASAAAPPSLEATLLRVFGHDTFREGQRDVCEALCEGRDVCVFWATGHGKSLAYQLPAMHLGRPAIVISPLIALMQDQCTKLNSTVGEGVRTIAVALNSATHHDASIEAAVWRGEVPLLYVSPERLASPGFMERLERLHASVDGGLAFVAVDEAHCICEWGHDFRKEYRDIGRLRENPTLRSVPIMGIVVGGCCGPREEIFQSLSLRTPLVSLRTFDRPNLRVRVQTKSAFGTTAERHKMIREKLGATKGASAIIYVATRKQCEEIEKVLLQHSSGSGPPLTASAYHAGMPTAERHRIHNDFLQGRIQVIVATVAFGMGIDKPDIRYIIHDGPPKTMEEYFQQVGRAGRDGCMSDCWMFYTEHEFVNYQSDFYMGALSGPARAATEESLAALRRYATNGVECRRKSMLEYFGEKAAFEQCGTCDICERTKAAGGVDGLRHDFTAPARVVLTAVRYAENNKLGITGLLDVLWGAYKPKTGSVSMELETAMRELTQMRTMLKPPYSKLAFKDLVPLLTGGGFITVVPRSIQAGQYTRVYESFELSSMGRAVLVNPNARVMLPASEAVLREEAEQKKALAKREQELVDAGIDLAQIPSNELLEGTGPVLNAYQHWIRTLKHYRECHQPARAVRLEALLQSVLEWRSRIAGKLGVAPVSLLSDHLARKIAYARPTDVGVLRAVGVRVAGAQELCDIIRQWMDTEAVVAAGGTTTGAASSGALRRQLKIPDHFKPATNALSTVSAPPTRKLVKQPPWEISYDRFQLHNEHPQAIAMSQPSGRPVQVSTVFGHLLTAITHGRPLDLARALHTCDVTLPSVEKYERYRAAVVASGVDVMDEKVLMKPILTAIVGEEVVDKLEKSEAEKAMISEWYAVLRLLTTLQRAGVPVEVVDEESVESSSMKRQRV